MHTQLKALPEQTSNAHISAGSYSDSSISINELSNPADIIAQAEVAAKALIEVVSRKKRPVIFNGEQYLEYEDWQTLGRFYQVTARVVRTQYVEYGDVVGFEAVAEAVHAPTGNIISSAEAACLTDEPHWTERKGSRVPLFQQKSMAQTRACAKALRSCLSWIAVLAGYRPTPAEEMTGEEVQEAVGPVEEFDFAIKRKETTGEYGKALEYWNRWDEVIAAGLAVEFSKSTRSGKQYKAWRTDSHNLDLSKPIKTTAAKAAVPEPENQTNHLEPLPDVNTLTKEQLDQIRAMIKAQNRDWKHDMEFYGVSTPALLTRDQAVEYIGVLTGADQSNTQEA